MDTRYYTSKDLARTVFSELKARKLSHPRLNNLISLFQSLYSASLHSEESRPITFDIVYLNPKDPDPKPPPNIRLARWKYFRLSETLPLTVANLIKISKASDPRTSSLAVYHDDKSNKQYLWGLIDHGIEYYEFSNYDSDQGPERPGLFQVGILGTGHLTVLIDYERIAELRIDKLVLNSLDVFYFGPVKQRLTPGIQTYLRKTKASLPAPLRKLCSGWESSLIYDWTSTLQRLLLRIQTFHHGGAFVIATQRVPTGLNIKYQLQYRRLQTAIATRARLTIRNRHFLEKSSDYMETNADSLPMDFYLDESITANETRDNDNEVDGAIWFVSLLTRVDGLVLMDQNLSVKGFGVEITYDEEPEGVFMAGDRDGSRQLLRRVDYNHYGTRHRSMMRYCANVPGSLGFVVSQDGDVRIMTQVHGRLVMWENIKLQVPYFVNQLYCGHCGLPKHPERHH